MKRSFGRLAVATLLLLAPITTFASTTIVGGVSNTGSFFGISFGSGSSGIGGCPTAICGVASTILYIINYVLVPVLFAVAFIVLLYGIASAYIFSRGDSGRVEEGHKLILWGIVAFAVMISIWGLVNVVASTFGLAGYEAPPLPTSYPTY